MSTYEVLLIDDQKIVGAAIRRMLLGEEDIRIHQHLTSNDALSAILVHDPDVILLDLTMPGLSGMEVLALIRREEKLERTPVVVLSSHEDPVIKSEAFGAGATDYLVKLPDRVELIARLRSHGRAGRAMQETDRLIHQLRHIQTELEVANMQLAKANTELALQSTQDGLTGLANRRRFDEALDTEWKRALREQASLVLLMVDVDFFKPYNDIYGHLGGDNTLVQVAKALKESVQRPADLVARYGGEEFAAILPNTDLKAAALATRLCQAVAALKISHKGSTWEHVTVSIGVAAAYPTRELGPNDLIEAADQALYRAKERGRNRHELAPIVGHAPEITPAMRSAS